MEFARFLITLVARVLELFPMKQLALMMLVLIACGIGSLSQPFWAVLLYYGFAVMRPQHLWEWAIPIEIRWSLIAAVTVFVSVGLNFSKVINKSRVNMISVLMSIYGILLLMSLLNAHDPQLAQHWGVEYVKVLVMALLASLIINRLWHFRVLTGMILITLGYIAWEVNYLYVINNRLDIFHYGFAGLDNNGAGILLAMGLPFAYVFGVTAPRMWQRAAAWFLGVLLLHALLMTYSRGAMLSALIGIAWLLIHYRSRLKAAIITLFICVMIGLLAGPQIRDRFLSTANYKTDGSAQSRLESWEAAWTIALEHPIAGQGIRNSSLYIQNYGADRRGRTIHSQYLQLAADSGLVTMIAFIAMLGISVIYLGRSRRMCAAYLRRPGGHGQPLTPPELEIRDAEQIALGCQTCLIIFAVGGIFLSLEVVELPWLVMVLAGTMPAAIRHQLTTMGVIEHGKKPVQSTNPQDPTPWRPQTSLPGGMSQRLVPQ